MDPGDLTSAQWAKLLGRIGYGNPRGRFWFVGMEEGGEGTFQKGIIYLCTKVVANRGVSGWESGGSDLPLSQTASSL